MSLGPQYTSCVEPKDFTGLSTALIATLGVLIGVGGIASLFTFGIGALVAIAALVQLLRHVLNFMLNGKLICLHRNVADCNCGSTGNTVCAIGEVADTEAVGEDKNPFEDIDNDYAMNLVLAPFDMRQVGIKGEPNSAPNVDVTLAGSPQVDLLAEQPGMPKFAGYRRSMVYQLVDSKYQAWSEIVGRDYGWGGIVGPDQQQRYGDYLLANAWLQPRRAQVPVFHCEFEGSRINDMLKALEAFSFGGSWCKKNWFFGALCVILQTLFAPFALAAVAIAWAAASDGDPADALIGGGTISAREWVVARGRWVYDGGHDGYNEMHATRVVQKISRDNVPMDPVGFRNYWKTWCERLSEVPHVLDSGLHPLTPEQQAVADNQNKPENQWVLHPEVDGCTPEPNDPRHGSDGPIIK
jgi:hypothetical protein